MIELSQMDMVQLLVKKIGAQVSGTVNEVDPTSYSKGSKTFIVEYGYTEHSDMPPEPEEVKASFHDFTYGIVVVFETSIGDFNGTLMDGYWNFDMDESFYKGSHYQQKFFRIFKDVLFGDPA